MPEVDRALTWHEQDRARLKTSRSLLDKSLQISVEEAKCVENLQR